MGRIALAPAPSRGALGILVENSLNSLVAGKKKTEVVKFITTRAFIKRLKSDFAGTNIPTKNYDAIYLTAEEKRLVGRRILEGP